MQGRLETPEPRRPKVESAPVAASPRTRAARETEEEPVLAVYARPVPTLSFARPELSELTPDPVPRRAISQLTPDPAPRRAISELTPDPVPRRVVAESRPRVASSPSIEVRTTSVAPGELVPSRPPPPELGGAILGELPDSTSPTDAAAWPSTLRPGTSRATIAIGGAAVLAALVIGLALRSGSRTPRRAVATPPSATMPVARTREAQPSATRAEPSASPAPTVTAEEKATPPPAETAAAPKVAAVAKREAAEPTEPPVTPPPRRREALASQLSNAAQESITRLGSGATQSEEKPANKPPAKESRSGLDDPAPAKTSETGHEAKRKALTEPGF
jgi:hypothetical protein